MIITPGFSDDERPRVAQLYWGAFGGKLGRVMGPEPKARAFIEAVLDPSHAISARGEDGTLLGIVGFKTAKGALVGGGWADMRAAYGTFGAAWRAAALSLLERDVDNTRFLLDGIFVAPDARGKGAGSALLDAITQEAANRGYALLRLDVIDSNTRARALYERRGFYAVETQNLGPFRHLFGFRSATTMVRETGA